MNDTKSPPTGDINVVYLDPGFTEALELLRAVGFDARPLPHELDGTNDERVWADTLAKLHGVLVSSKIGSSLAGRLPSRSVFIAQADVPAAVLVSAVANLLNDGTLQHRQLNALGHDTQ